MVLEICGKWYCFAHGLGEIGKFMITGQRNLQKGNLEKEEKKKSILRDNKGKIQNLFSLKPLPDLGQIGMS